MAIWNTSSDEEGLNKRLHQICFKTNFSYDNLLLPYDIKALIAHGEMLVAKDLISQQDGTLILTHLQTMYEQALKGEIAMSDKWEDCHSLIEDELIKHTGDAGKRLYMARKS